MLEREMKYIFPYKRLFMKHIYNKIIAYEHYCHDNDIRRKFVKVICNEDNSLIGYMIYSRVNFNTDIVVHSTIKWLPDKGYIEVIDNDDTSPEQVIRYYKSVICDELIFPFHEWWYIVSYNCENAFLSTSSNQTRDILSYEEYLMEYPPKLLSDIEAYLAHGLSQYTSIPYSPIIQTLSYDNNKIRIDTKCRYLLEYLDNDLEYAILHYIIRIACHLNLHGLLKQTLIKVRDLYGYDFQMSSDIIDTLKNKNNKTCLSILKHYIII